MSPWYSLKRINMLTLYFAPNKNMLRHHAKVGRQIQVLQLRTLSQYILQHHLQIWLLHFRLSQVFPGIIPADLRISWKLSMQRSSFLRYDTFSIDGSSFYLSEGMCQSLLWRNGWALLNWNRTRNRLDHKLVAQTLPFYCWKYIVYKRPYWIPSIQIRRQVIW